MLLLGIDIGTSSVKVSVVSAATKQSIVSACFPKTESPIISQQLGWAEQSPEMWWEQTKEAIKECQASGKYISGEISAIGVAYQMHGLVLVDQTQKVLRNSIIWCDSRAVEIGEQAFNELGREFCLEHFQNSPGNFTASKLSWVKRNEPEIYDRIDKVMLPGDYIAMKLTGEITTSASALSEGIFYDFQQNQLSEALISYFGFERVFFPEMRPVFAEHGRLSSGIASELGLPPGIPIAYKAGDQPNNALSLNVLRPGEVAATAGTSGVIYGITDQLACDRQSRINSFAHVNYTKEERRMGMLLCINGTGSLNRWARNVFGARIGYDKINDLAIQAPLGCSGLRVLPFGNGAERMLNNQLVGVHFQHIDLNLHTQAHLFRAVQEGIACAFRYGLDIMRANGMNPTIIRAGKANLFLSELFTQAFVNITGVPVELYQNDGSVGAALGAGIGAKIFGSTDEAFEEMAPIQTIEPSITAYETVYQEWYELLGKQLKIAIHDAGLSTGHVKNFK